MEVVADDDGLLLFGSAVDVETGHTGRRNADRVPEVSSVVLMAQPAAAAMLLFAVARSAWRGPWFCLRNTMAWGDP
ncbi:hypothetical protein [Streptomyces asiaticus]|uniref:hypothetical protein n=1 Tax=Streptomyces asiaticus TaxID=114695 RepID=UPI003F6779CB